MRTLETLTTITASAVLQYCADTHYGVTVALLYASNRVKVTRHFATKKGGGRGAAQLRRLYAADYVA